MESVLEQIRGATRGLILLGVVSIWASIQGSPDVLGAARSLANDLLFPMRADQICESTLVAQPRHIREPLQQYQFLYRLQTVTMDASLVASQRETLRDMPVGALLEFADAVLIETHEQQSEASALGQGLTEIVAATRRRRLGLLQGWFEQSQLSEYATLNDLETAVATQVTLPVIDQAVNLDQLMVLVGVALVGMNLFLSSHTTLIGDSLDTIDLLTLRSWLPMHHGRLGGFLFVLVAMLPVLAWIWCELVMPMGMYGHLPSLGQSLLSFLVVSSALSMLRRTRRLRRRVEQASMRGNKASIPTEDDALDRRLQRIRPRRRAA
ncbi:MAG: hypothetical protein AAGD07_06335 [Planctomycetota bacterium]